MIDTIQEKRKRLALLGDKYKAHQRARWASYLEGGALGALAAAGLLGAPYSVLCPIGVAALVLTVLSSRFDNRHHELSLESLRSHR